jgi:nicotinate-nucleotide adenylyltransferase
VGVGLYGGVFDPPHNGHVAFVEAAAQTLDLERLVILVAEAPGHKRMHAPADVRLRLARAAFPEWDVEIDPFPRTVDMLRARRFDDPVFLIGADQFADFGSWKEPEAVLELARLGVATRPGYALPSNCRSDRISLFGIPEVNVSSTDVRRRVAASEPIGDLVPQAVADLIAELGLYRPSAGPG